ncbi:MAG: malonyl-CoA decarboxylase N-terminal domain-containing protein, partial [Hansschlegelia sp.]
MSDASFFGDLMQSIAERGRRLLALGPAGAPTREGGPLSKLCETLLSARGEASGMALAKGVLDRWAKLQEPERKAFMAMLLADFGPDAAKLDEAIDAYRADPNPKAAQRLHAASEPRRQELIRRLNLAPDGVGTLVRMREELLRMKAGEPALDVVDDDFAHLFSSWFNRGFLVLRHIDWTT